ncbi:hypothetical protein PP175_27630 (plasmid) [Aneurinibacillus sp. Ricciae_BoGa-3]|uniref:hypothetical protein n=1 Tax=Aneurinibacillus sp. Ricciae_BoGa-3 TaxID=3022697 RepID=UPI002340AFFE|nr:hypothetical protein [Aneurinibacillus sp. Ricciae_BoGa-3]WCK56965.1 hypothetical protein PP175_27630 [Aneurinibacillus sp. Ricciae_BoGa-3]
MNTTASIKAIERVRRFFNRQNVHKLLMGRVSFLVPDRSDINLVLNPGGGSYTDGKTVTLGLPELFYDKSYEEMYMALWALAGHETQHINSSDFTAFVQFQNDMSTYFSKNLKLPGSYGQKIAKHVANSVEDGRIEKILVNRLPGYLKKIQFLNGSIREAQPIEGKSELGDFLYTITMLSVTGLYPKDYAKFYKGTELDANIKKIKKDIITGINAVSCKQCLMVCQEIIEKVEDYLIKLIGQQNPEDNQFIQNIPQQHEFTTSEEKEQNASRSISTHFKPEKKEEEQEEPQEGQGSGSSAGEEKEEENKEEQKGKGKGKSEKEKSEKDKLSDGESQEGEPSEENEQQEGNQGGKDEEKEESDEANSKENEEGEEDSEDSSRSEENSKDDSDEPANGESDKETDEKSEGDFGEQSDENSTEESTEESNNKSDTDSNSDSDENSNTSDEEGKSRNKQPQSESESESPYPQGIDQDEEDDFEIDEEAIRARMKEITDDVLEEAKRKMEEEFKNPKTKSSKNNKDEEISLEEVKEIENLYRNQYVRQFKEIKGFNRTFALPADIKREGAKFRKEVEKIFRNKESLTLRGQKQGILDTTNLWKFGVKDYNLFVKRTPPITTDYVAYLLQDGSGSMVSNEKQFHSAKALSVMEEGLKGIIPFKVTTFSVQGAVMHYTAKDFKDNSMTKNYSYSFHRMRQASGGNKDGYSIRVATAELMKRPEKDRILIVLSDGLPSDYNKGQREGMVDVKQAVKEARAKGIHVVSLIFGTDSFREGNIDLYKYMYDKNIISCSPEEITKNLVKTLKKIISR